MNKASTSLFVCFVLLLFNSSCQTDGVYKELKECDGAIWAVDDVKKFEFEISDPTKEYKLNYLIRNAIQYPFYNIYLKSWLRDSTGKEMRSGMEEIILFDEKTGKPFGSGLGDFFDHQVSANQYKEIKFPYAGKYTFEIQHNMRPDPLVGLLSVGLEVLENKEEK